MKQALGQRNRPCAVPSTSQSLHARDLAAFLCACPQEMVTRSKLAVDSTSPDNSPRHFAAAVAQTYLAHKRQQQGMQPVVQQMSSGPSDTLPARSGMLAGLLPHADHSLRTGQALPAGTPCTALFLQCMHDAASPNLFACLRGMTMGP